VSPSEEEYEAAKAALVEAGFTESQVSRILNKPKRAYTKDSNWKEEAKAIYAETGVITRSQIMSTEGFPKSSNPSQTVKRFIGWLQKQTEAELTHDKKSDSWSVLIDNTEYIDLLLSKIQAKLMTKQTFEKYCSVKGLNTTTTKNTLKERNITVLPNGDMEWFE
jgi:hypothetical protein